MTEVAFHVTPGDKVAYACRLLRKAHGTGAKVVVTGEAATLGRLDVELWTFSPLEFIPHVQQDSATPDVLAVTPVVLTPHAAGAPHREVLVNLGPGVPEGFERYERLIELVAPDDADRVLGRRRWRHYAERGYQLAMHERAAREG